MKARRFVGMAGAAFLVATLQTQAARAQLAPYAHKSAKRYVVTLARAMDECVPGNQVTVVNPGNVGACFQANTDTDSFTGLKWGFLEIAKHGNDTRIRLNSRGFTPPRQAVGVQLKIRTTNSTTSSPPPASKTYEDLDIVCGPWTVGSSCGHYFLTSEFGGILGSQTLSECLAANNLSTAPASGNIELLDAALINCDTGKVIAKAGVIK